MRRNIQGFLLVFLPLLMWALSFPSLKVLLDEVDPLTLASLRFFIAMPVIYGFYVHESKKRDRALGLKKERKDIRARIRNWLRTTMDSAAFVSALSKLKKKDRVMLFAFAMFNVVFPNILQNYGMQSTSSGITSIIQGSGPIFTVVLAMIFLGERITRRQAGGIILAFIGSLLLVSGGEMDLDGSTICKLLILLSAISYAISGILAKKLLVTRNSAEMTFKSFTIGVIVLTSLAFILEDPFKLLGLGIVYWQHILFLALFPTGFAYIFWYRALKSVPLSRLAISVFLIPVMAVIFSFLFLGETLGWFSIATGCMVILGVLISQYEAVKKGLRPLSVSSATISSDEKP